MTDFFTVTVHWHINIFKNQYKCQKFIIFLACFRLVRHPKAFESINKFSIYAFFSMIKKKIVLLEFVDLYHPY